MEPIYESSTQDSRLRLAANTAACVRQLYVNDTKHGPWLCFCVLRLIKLFVDIYTMLQKPDLGKKSEVLTCRVNEMAVPAKTRKGLV